MNGSKNPELQASLAYGTLTLVFGAEKLDQDFAVDYHTTTLEQAVSRHDFEQLVIDIRTALTVDANSAALAIFTAIAKKIRNGSKPVTLKMIVGENARKVRQALSTTGLDRVYQVITPTH
jgi:hypothetical protein